MALVRDSFVNNKTKEEQTAYKEKIKDDVILTFEKPFLLTKEEADVERAKRLEEEK